MTSHHPPKSVLFVADGPAQAQAAALWHDVQGAWPAGEAPVAVFRNVRELGLNAGERDLPKGCAAVLFLGLPHAFSGVLRRFVETLGEQHVPIVCLDQSPRAPGRGLFGEIVSLPADASAQAIAGALSALVQRQHVVHDLHRQLCMEQALKASAGRELARHQVEVALAEVVQRAFMPACPPSLNGAELGVLFRPAGTLSGDIYDFVRLDDHRVAFFLADACGHGLPAAMITMLVSRMLPMTESIGLQNALVPPGEALRRLNAQFMRRRASDSTLVTAVYGVLDGLQGVVTLSGAGHPSAAVVNPAGVTLIDSQGPALGLFEDADFPQVSIPLPVGSTLLLHTDGFEQGFVAERSEAQRRRPSEQYREAFAQTFSHMDDRSVEQAVAQMAELLDRQHGSLHQYDDITLLAITRRQPVAQIAPMPQSAGGAEDRAAGDGAAPSMAA
jgi:serine phosphatase RsbU (regulator of sigma subunit)